MESLNDYVNKAYDESGRVPEAEAPARRLTRNAKELRMLMD